MSNHRLEGMQNGNQNGHQNGHGRISGNGQQAAQRGNEQAGQAAALSREWATDPRWAGIERTYSAADVIRLRGSVQEEHTLARIGAERLWSLLHQEPYLNTLGALTGNQAVQQVKAGLKAIYLSGWQVAADANLAGQTYPDQSLYPVNSVPQVVRRINNALLRADQIAWSESADGDTRTSPHWLAPIVADAEAGFGGVLNAYELMKSMIAAGAAGVHWEDQLASEKKCGHLGGKVLIPTSQHIRTLNAARLAADICGVRSLIVARTDAQSASLITSDVDERDQRFVTGERTAEGFYRVRGGIESCIARGLAYAPHAELLWMETGTPDLAVARERDLPVVLHVLRAHASALDILRADGLPRAGGVLHSCSAPADQVREYLKLGLHISFAGSVCNSNAKKVHEAARAQPRQRCAGRSVLYGGGKVLLQPLRYRAFGRQDGLYLVLESAARPDQAGRPHANLR